MDKTITLTLTANCNLSCIYCYETHNKEKRMLFETAKKILDFEIKGLKKDDLLTVEFFGGEPFLEFELIQQIVDYVKAQSSNGKLLSQFRFFASTNGTLVHENIQEFIKAQKNFFLGLSLDGTKDMHDTNRCNSFDDLDLDFFASMYPNQPVKMTISAETLPHLAEGVIFAHQKGFHVACNLAYGLDWSNRSYRQLLMTQLEKLAEYYLDHPDVERATILSRKISLLGYQQQNKNVVRKYCGTGTAMITYDTDGKRYPCQFFMPISCGEEKAAKAWEQPFADEFSLDQIEVKCRNCIVREGCPTCYGSNYAATGNILKRDPNLCVLEKITFFANAWLAIQMWDRGQFKDLPADETLATMIAAKEIISSFKAEIIS